jgi:putative tryptophan/tyrosine transport system substrate-binding protein
MASVGDPVGTGLIASLARPGSNITGNTAGGDASGKTVQFIREALPSARRAGVLVNAPDPFSKTFLGQVETTARALGIDLDVAMTTAAEIPDGHFEAFSRNKAEAVIIQPSLLRPAVVALALKHRLPSFAPHRSLPHSGGLMSYSGIDTDQWREVALYIDKILKGSRPADLPVALPTRYELIINLKTASALGLTIPPFLLASADTVIE